MATSATSDHMRFSFSRHEHHVLCRYGRLWRLLTTGGCADDRASVFRRGGSRAGVSARARAGPQAAEQPRRDAAQRLVAVRVARARGDQDGDGEPAAPAPEERHLMVDPAGARAPAALEVERPAARADARDPPALRRDDGAEQPQRVAAVAPGHLAVDVKEEAS